MRIVLLLLLLLGGCYVHARTPGTCLEQGDRVIQITNTRGLTMVYVRLWDSDKMEWSGPYPADTWLLLGLDTVECPLGPRRRQ